MHWSCCRSARVLIIDGEMPADLIKERAKDALRRIGGDVPLGNLVVFAQDMAEAFGKRFPELGPMPPLNTKEGHLFVLNLIENLGGVEVVFFDNVMSLVAGDQKDEVPWTDTLPLVSALTSRRIGQVWLDHTGHNTTRQYGSATKACRFDSVGIMTDPPENERRSGEMAFQLSFEPPGKARRRTPCNRDDFQTCIIRLHEDRWTSQAIAPTAGKGKDKSEPVRKGPSPSAVEWHAVLFDVLKTTSTPGYTTKTIWFDAGAASGLTETVLDTDTRTEKERKRVPFRSAARHLRESGWIKLEGELVWDVRNVEGSA